MPKAILMDELHLSFFVPRGRLDIEYRAIQQTLKERDFRSNLSRAVREVVRRYSSLRKVTIIVSQ